MLDLLKKYRFHIVTGVVLLAAFVFYSLNLKQKSHANAFEREVQNLMTPFYRVVDRISGAVTFVWEDYLDLVNVRRENKELRESVKTLNARLLETHEAVLANERLKKLLDMKNTLQIPTITASVIGEDSAPWFKTILIDRGWDDGLREGMAVVTSEGVAGQLVKVAAHSSRVLLLTDNASAIASVVQRSRARGVTKGKGGGRCSLDFALHDEDVKVGDMIVTSGIGGVFPKGMPVGEVTMVKKGDLGIFQTIEVRPAVNITRLEEVLVLLQQNND
jgi:rod shape-determining protein MreC